ncbi:MAG: hypothetical protein AB7O49_18185 [Sphingomonadales bacterium]
MKILPVTVALALGAALSGCDFKEGFDEGFDRGARESFIKSCVASITKVDAATATALCGCVSDHMSEQLTPAEMMNPVGGRAKQVEGEAVEACVGKLQSGTLTGS